MKSWKKEFVKIWGVTVQQGIPHHLTKEQAESFGLLGERGKKAAKLLPETSRPALMRNLECILELHLSPQQQLWCAGQLGLVDLPLVKEAKTVAKKDKEPLFERQAGLGPVDPKAAKFCPATGVPLANSSSAANSVPASIARPTGGYAYDADDADDGMGYTEKSWLAGTSNYNSGYSSSNASETEKKRMRKLPYRPGPYEFKRWADRATFKRTIVVGDLHGCADELLELLDYVKFQPDTDLLVSCGDVVDRGPKVSECFEIMREYEAIMALGNHEEPFLKWLLFETHPDYRDKWSGKNNPIDLTYREDQLSSLRQLKAADWADMLKMQLFHHLDWLHYDPLVVHAGLFPAVGPHLKHTPADMDPFAIIRMINLDAVHQPVPFYSNAGTPWWDVYDQKPGNYHVLYGHSTVKEYARIKKHSTGLDGGAVYGGALTCLVIDGEDDKGKKGTNWDVYSVKARPHYVSSAAEMSGGQNFTFGKVK